MEREERGRPLVKSAASALLMKFSSAPTSGWNRGSNLRAGIFYVPAGRIPRLIASQKPCLSQKLSSAVCGRRVGLTHASKRGSLIQTKASESEDGSR